MNRTKQAIFEGMLTQEPVVVIYLDARKPGVDVPEHLKTRCLGLEYGLNMPVPIPDLVSDEHGITATLSFARASEKTFIPWSAVFIVCNRENQGMVFHADVPPPEKDAEALTVGLSLVPQDTSEQGEQEERVSSTWVPKVIPGGLN